MGLSIGAVVPCAGSIGTRITDIGVERIARLEANASPFTSGLGKDNLNLNIKVIGLLHISHRDFIVIVPFFPAAIQHIEPRGAHRYNLTGPYRHTRLRPLNRAYNEGH